MVTHNTTFLNYPKGYPDVMSLNTLSFIMILGDARRHLLLDLPEHFNIIKLVVMELCLSLSRFKVTVIYKDIESGNFLLDTEVNTKIFYCGTTRITDKNK